MKEVFSEKYRSRKKEILKMINSFNSKGISVDEPARNSIKVFTLEGEKINIKSFRIPNAINKIAYRFFRKSKAERSYNYARILQQKGIGTPEPVAYMEEKNSLSFGKSYYVSRHIDYDLTYRELVSNPELEDHELILRQFTKFTYDLHENGILFLDHSPGNTLIKKEAEKKYSFYLVDLNRMVFKPLNEVEKIRNFRRLTPKKEMVEVMADEYSKLSGQSTTETFEKMWFFTQQFQEKFHRKKRLKKKLKFWKK